MLCSLNQVNCWKANPTIFISFVEQLISSQAHQEWWEGSETRDEKPERLKRLHERLKSLRLTTVSVKIKIMI